MHIPILETIERLCYRYPSALVDAVTDYEPGKRMVAVPSFLSRICGAGSVAHLFAYLMAFEDSQGKTTSSARSRGST